MSPGDLIDFIRPPEPPEGADPETRAKFHAALHRHRWNVTLSILALMLYCAWSMTDWGFARAADVDGKIEKAIAPIRDQVDSLKKEQQEQRTIIEKTQELAIENQASDYEGKIVDFKTRQCEAQKTGQEKVVSTWRELVLDYQNRYLKLTHRNFPAPSCADL